MEEESRAAPVASSRMARWRAPWLVPAGLASWLVPAGLTLLLALLTASVLAGGPLASLDRGIRAAVHAQAAAAGWRWLSAGRLAPAQLITDLGAARIAGVVLAVSAIAVAARQRSLRPVVIAAAGAALLAATVIPAKILIARPGPGYASLASGAWGDFPSGHASTAGVCYGLAVLLLTAGPRSASLRRAAVAVAAAVTFLVGVALVWCDYHWFTDVAAGWTLAVFIVWAVWQVQRRLAWWHPVVRRSTRQSDNEIGRKAAHSGRSRPDDRARA